MSYFDDASLVMIPSGYKTSKVYSVKPTDGTGDLTFTRSNDTATRVGPDGLIEKVRTNLSFYSEQFDNGFWNKLGTGLTVTANTTIAPNGTLTADTLNVSNNNNVLYGSRSTALAGNEFTFSIYVKGTGTFGMNVRLNSVTTTTQTKTLTSDWQRFSVSVTNSAPVTSVEFFLDLNTSSTYIVWGAQVESSPVATSYIVTTTDAVSVGPVANVPRLDYLNSSCPRLLLEPQRTNSATYSEQINNAAWSKLNVTVSQNQAVGPDGTTSADLVYPTTNGADRLIEQIILATVGQTWTSSFFVKASGFSWVLIYAPNLGACWFNASTGVFGTIAAGVTATVLGQVNGYWRISFTGTLASSNAYFYAGPADANGTITATANGTNGLLFWGCQLEQGAYATSYIPTLGAAVTRGADAASKTGISSLIGQTEGTIFYDFVFKTGANTTDGQFGISTSAENDRVIVWNNFSLSTLGLQIKANSTNVINNVSLGTFVDGTTYKMAVAYKSGSTAVYVNGTQVYTSITTFTFAASLTDFIVGAYGTSGFNAHQKVNQTLLFKTRLSNADLAALTA